jgi:hypothetical protein
MTHHGDKRMRERIGLPKSAVRRMEESARLDGIRREEFSGSIRRYLDKQFVEGGRDKDIRIYSQHIFIFKGETLITCWRLPHKYTKAKVSTK